MDIRNYALLVLVTACGGAAQPPPATATPSASASAADSASETTPPAPSSSAAADSAPPPSDSSTASSDGASSDDAPRANDDDEKIDPLKASVKFKAVTKALPNTPLTASVPMTAVIEADRSDTATISPEGQKGYGILTVGGRGVMFEPFDKELAELEKQKLPVVSKRGSGVEYAIVYKPYPNMYTYERFFSLGGKDFECVVEGLYRRSEIPMYDAICKSVKLKK